MTHSFTLTGPNGVGYYCDRCGISRTKDYYFHTCESYISEINLDELRSPEYQEKWQKYWLDFQTGLFQETFETEDATVRYQDTPELREKIFKEFLEFCIKHRVFSSEAIPQSDSVLLALPDFMCSLMDAAEFRVVWK